jgi:anti-sigma factor RsiW
MSAGGDGHLGDALSGLLDGELPLTQELAARQHLAACPACALEYEQVHTARAWVRGLPAVDPPFGFLEGLLLHPPAAAVPLLARRWVRVGAGAVSAAAAVALLGFASPRDAPVSPPVNRMVEAHAAGASINADPLTRLAPLGVPVSFRR